MWVWRRGWTKSVLEEEGTEYDQNILHGFFQRIDKSIISKIDRVLLMEFQEFK